MHCRRIIVAILAMMLVLSLAPTALGASSDFTIENGELTHYNGPGGDVVIPDGVTSIGYSAFKDCTSLTSITIPESVTVIGPFAFQDCNSLSSATIPQSVTTIGLWAFCRCKSLTSISLPETVTTIRSGAFAECTGLRSVVVPSKVTYIDAYTFANCDNLVSITLPRATTFIGEQAFSGCSSLSNMTIPESVTTIGMGAFLDCSNMKTVTIPESVSAIGDYVFSGCTNMSSITIPAGVTAIGEGAFFECTSLSSVTIPESVTIVGKGAFGKCSSLRNVTLSPGVTTIEEKAFKQCLNLENIVIPSTVTTIRGVIVTPGVPVLFHVAPNSTAAVYAHEYEFASVDDQVYVDPAPYIVMPQSVTAYPSTQTVAVQAIPVTFQMYALRDDNGNLTNYVKLRDLAYALYSDPFNRKDFGYGPDTFQVEWNGAITVLAHTDYTPNGTEMQTPFSGERICVHAPQEILFNDGNRTTIRTLDSLQIQDDQGGGYTYFKLRDLGDLLGKQVRWDAEEGITFGW